MHHPLARLGALALLLASGARPARAQTTNRPPVAATTGPYVSASRNVVVDGRPSSDPDGDALTYAWDFGDATTGTGATAKHEYVKRGTYTVKLVVTDSKGAASAPATTSMLVHFPPDANPGGPYTGAEGAAVQLDGSASSDRDGNLPLTYAWNFGDGTTGTGVQPTHVYAQNGSFTVGLVVTDALGAPSTRSSTTATITNVVPTVTIAALPASAVAGSAVTLTGSFTDPGPDSPWSWTIDWGDGTATAPSTTTGTATSTATQISGAHSYAAAGAFTVVLRVKDKDLGEGTAQRALSVTGGTTAPPVAAAGGPYTATEGASVSFDGSGSTGGGTLAYAWDFGDGTTGTGATPTKQYAQNGSYQVALTVTDGGGATGRSTTTATISNVAPTATATLSATSIAGGSQVTLDGTFSDPGTDSPWSYAIDWGDGTANTTASITGTGPAASTALAASHTYAVVQTSQTYTVVLRVTDKDGAVGTAPSLSIAVSAAANRAPVATIANAPYTAAEGAKVTLTGSASDPDGDALSYKWDFGDGTPVATGTGASPAATHAYAQDGSYTVTLTVTDTKGASTPATTTATITNVAPTVTIAALPASAVAGSAVTLTGSFTDPGPDSPWSWTIDWGDGTATAPSTTTGTATSTATQISGAHSYAAAGAFTVVLRVKDKDLGEGTAQRALTVGAAANRPPVAAIAGLPYTGAEGATGPTLDGSGSTDPDGDTLTYAWDFGDGTTGAGATPTKSYTKSGTFTVKLTVSDGRGGSGQATGTASVTNVAPTVTATLSATSIAGGNPVTLTGSFTDPGTDDAPWGYTIDWGDGTATSTGSLTSAAASIDVSHTYAVVQANQTYTVVLRVKDKDLAEGSVQNALTVTPPPAAAQVLLVAGDIADCGRNTDEQTAAVLATQVQRYPNATVLTGGDNVYPDATLSTLQSCYGPSWGQFKSRTWATVGNHEYTTAMPNAEGHHAYFGDRAGPIGKAYYTFVLGDWQIFVLNSEISRSKGSTQELWLNSELAKSTKRCTLAIWHRPRFFSGSVSMENTSFKPLWSDLYATGAEIIIGGHYHNYERFAPQDANGDADPSRGIREFIVGTGGKDVVSFGTPAPNSEVRSKTAFGVLKLTLTSTGYSWEFLPAGTSTFTDSGAGTCH